jgi:hypothetical protein
MVVERTLITLVEGYTAVLRHLTNLIYPWLRRGYMLQIDGRSRMKKCRYMPCLWVYALIYALVVAGCNISDTDSSELTQNDVYGTWWSDPENRYYYITASDFDCFVEGDRLFGATISSWEYIENYTTGTKLEYPSGYKISFAINFAKWSSFYSVGDTDNLPLYLNSRKTKFCLYGNAGNIYTKE